MFTPLGQHTHTHTHEDLGHFHAALTHILKPHRTVYILTELVPRYISCAYMLVYSHTHGSGTRS